MSIYTRNGDEGFADLADGSRVSKADLRVQAMGAVDELSCQIGLAVVAARAVAADRKRRPAGRQRYEQLTGSLEQIQHQLATALCRLARAEPGQGYARLDAAVVSDMEAWIDAVWNDAGNLQGFCLPGGCELGARLHLARAVCRRAECLGVAAGQAGLDVPNIVMIYLNRLSDLLYSLAVVTNRDLAG